MKNPFTSGTSLHRQDATITRSSDPGRIGAYFHYVHAILVAGIIGAAVGNDLVLDHPHAHPGVPQMAVLLAGPAIFLLGCAVYKKVVYDRVPLSHIVGVLVLMALAPVAGGSDMLLLGVLTTLVMLGVSFWEARLMRKVARQSHA